MRLRLGIPDLVARRHEERARAQEKKSLELRVATSLARLWQRHGKLAEARAAGACPRLVHQGFDTGGLIEAKALLEHLT